MKRSAQRRRAGRTRLDALVDRIGWSHNQSADKFGVSITTWMRWVDDLQPTPKLVLNWMERVANAIDKIGPPPLLPRSGRGRPQSGNGADRGATQAAGTAGRLPSSTAD